MRHLAPLVLLAERLAPRVKGHRRVLGPRRPHRRQQRVRPEGETGHDRVAVARLVRGLGPDERPLGGHPHVGAEVRAVVLDRRGELVAELPVDAVGGLLEVLDVAQAVLLGGQPRDGPQLEAHVGAALFEAEVQAVHDLQVRRRERAAVDVPVVQDLGVEDGALLGAKVVPLVDLVRDGVQGHAVGDHHVATRALQEAQDVRVRGRGVAVVPVGEVGVGPRVAVAPGGRRVQVHEHEPHVVAEVADAGGGANRRPPGRVVRVVRRADPGLVLRRPPHRPRPSKVLELHRLEQHLRPVWPPPVDHVGELPLERRRGHPLEHVVLLGGAAGDPDEGVGVVRLGAREGGAGQVGDRGLVHIRGLGSELDLGPLAAALGVGLGVAGAAAAGKVAGRGRRRARRRRRDRRRVVRRRGRRDGTWRRHWLVKGARRVRERRRRRRR